VTAAIWQRQTKTSASATTTSVSDDSAFGRSHFSDEGAALLQPLQRRVRWRSVSSDCHFSDDGAALLQPLQRRVRWRSVSSDCHFSDDGKTISISDVMYAAAAFYSPLAAAASVQQQQPRLQCEHLAAASASACFSCNIQREPYGCFSLSAQL
jgi:hypothetical protein